MLGEEKNTFMCDKNILEKGDPSPIKLNPLP